jgi:hypothetical protein
MPILKPGTRCVMVAGCKENIGLLVQVIQRLGAYERRSDAYYLRTISGRKFDQLWMGNELQRGSSDECVTERRKLRPTIDLIDQVKEIQAEDVK